MKTPKPIIKDLPLEEKPILLNIPINKKNDRWTWLRVERMNSGIKVVLPHDLYLTVEFVSADPDGRERTVSLFSPLMDV